MFAPFLYSIIWNGHSVGTVEMQKEGMFYRFICYCKLPDEGIYRITVRDDENVYDLGVCVPNGNTYICITRVPCNKLNGNKLSFALSNDNDRKGIPIATGKTFAHLEKLNTARMHIANGQAEIIIDPFQDQQGSGQNQIYQNKS